MKMNTNTNQNWSLPKAVHAAAIYCDVDMTSLYQAVTGHSYNVSSSIANARRLVEQICWDAGIIIS